MSEQVKMWRPKMQGVVRWSGGRQLLRTTDTFEDGHALVAERPDLFELAEIVPTVKAPTREAIGQGSDEPPIERGTRAPGEKRKATSATKGRPSGIRMPGDRIDWSGDE